MMRAMRWTIALLCLMPLAVSAAEQEKKDAQEKVVVRKGDSLSRIAGRLWWKKFYEANKAVVDNPNLIFPGQVLVVPRLSAGEKKDKHRLQMVDSVRILYATPEQVSFKKANEEIVPVEGGMNVLAVGEISVGSGTAVLQFADGSILRLGEGTVLGLNGVVMDVMKEAKLRYLNLRRGSLDAELSHTPTKRERFQVETPVALVNSSSRYFRVEEETGNATRILCYMGKLHVVGKARFVDIGIGEGVYIAGNGFRMARVRLPKPPEMIAPKGIVNGKAHFRWKPQPAADHYLLTVASDKQMNDVQFVGDVFDAAEFEISFRNDGEYFWRVDAVNKLGFRSPPTVKHRFIVQNPEGQR